MAVHTVSQTRELNLDFDKTCPSCSNAYKVICRVYGQAAASYGSAIFTNPGARARNQVESQSAHDAMKKTGKAKLYQRCPKCGLYDPKDIEQLRQIYPDYRATKKFKKVAGMTFGVIFAGLFLLGAVNMLIDPTVPKNLGTWSMLVALLLLSSWILGKTLKGKILSESEFVQRLNSPAVVEKWLNYWHAKSHVTERAEFQQASRQEWMMNERKELWSSIEYAQHYLDFPRGKT